MIPPAAPRSAALRYAEPASTLPWLEARKNDLATRPLVREQAFGEALNPDKLERLGRHEVHLDRKLERMLSMLQRLKDLRRGTVPTTIGLVGPLDTNAIELAVASG